MAAGKKISKKVAKKPMAVEGPSSKATAKKAASKKVVRKKMPAVTAEVVAGDMYYIEITNKALTKKQKDAIEAWLEESHDVVAVVAGSGGRS